MYNDKLQTTIIDSLESKEIDIVNSVISLASQGYIVNRAKHVKLNICDILLNAFENINIFTKEQQANLERIYNKLSTL